MNEKSRGGLYRNIKVSVRTVNAVILTAVILLIGVTVFVVRNNGFVISFDTDGGSRVESVRGFYSELLIKPENPVREGYTFSGWYTDAALTDEWDFASDTVGGDLTLYAGYSENIK